MALSSKSFRCRACRQAVLSEGKIVELDDDGLGQFVDALAQYCAPGATLFPAPYSEHGDRIRSGTTTRSMREHLATLKLPPAMRDAVDGMCSLIAFGPLDRAAATECMRVFALSGCSPIHMLAALSAVKLVKVRAR